MSNSSFNFADWYAMNKGEDDCLADNALEAISPELTESANIEKYVKCQKLRSEAVVIVLAVITVLIILFFIATIYFNDESDSKTTGIAGAVVTGLIGGGLCLFVYFSTEMRATTEMKDTYVGINKYMKQNGLTDFTEAYKGYVEQQYKKEELNLRREHIDAVRENRRRTLF